MLPEHNHLRKVVVFFLSWRFLQTGWYEGLCPARQLDKALSDSAFIAPYADSSVIIPAGMWG